MKRRYFTVLFATGWCLLAGLIPAQAQQVFRNIVNAPFRTVSNGPLSAHIVDVSNPNDPQAVREAIRQQVGPWLQARNAKLQVQMEQLRRSRRLRPGQQLDIVDTIYIRHKGRLVLPKPPKRERTRGGGDELTFTIPVGTGSGEWTASEANRLETLKTVLYPTLKNILGQPGWSGDVRILERTSQIFPDPAQNREVLGAQLVINGEQVEIWFAKFSTDDTRVLAMAQTMAQAFHAKSRIAYDAWEVGMARAAAVIAAADPAVRLQLTQAGIGNADPNNTFYYTSNYDLLNQPALGNDTFTPPTKSSQKLDPTTLAGMLVPRLQMASTAWLKCWIEDPDFFKRFNTGQSDGKGNGGYYGAYVADPTLANDVNRLRNLAKTALPTIEGLPFDDWFERQYIFDTRVTQGAKLYVYSFATLPDASSEAGAGFFVVYYQTFLASDGKGDERDRDGSIEVIYWDYTFQNRLTFPSYDRVTIANGFGAVAPEFTGIGTNPRMRLAVDFPVNREYVRVYFPANQQADASKNPKDFSGTVIGANTGTLTTTYLNTGGTQNSPVEQGSFGVQGVTGSLPNGFARVKLEFKPETGPSITYYRNIYQRPDSNEAFGVAPIYLLHAPNPTDTVTLSHTFPIGTQLISLPITPFTNDLAQVLGLDPTKALLAQFRQDISGNDKYLRYPSLPLYQPGYALWTKNSNSLISNAIRGLRTDTQQEISIALQYGWNQIGSPYEAALIADASQDTGSDISFQYRGSEVVSLAKALSNGWVAAGILGYAPSSGYFDIATPPEGFAPKNTLEPWKGYWILVRVSEGVTLTFSHPNSRAARLRSPSRRVRPDANAWNLPLALRDGAGNTTKAVLGQAAQGSDGYNSGLDVLSPPVFPGTTGLALRSLPPTGTAVTEGRDYLKDVRRSAARTVWELEARADTPEQELTLTWEGTALLPRNTRLTLIDKVSGKRQTLNGASTYTFRLGKEELTRRFEVLAEPRSLGRLLIRNVTAFEPPPVGGRAAGTFTISYELSTVAETLVEIRQGARVVRRLTPSGRAASNGVNQLAWDRKDDQGRTLPAGLYQLQITARTAEGELTRSITPLLMTR